MALCLGITRMSLTVFWYSICAGDQGLKAIQTYLAPSIEGRSKRRQEANIYIPFSCSRVSKKPSMLSRLS